VSTAACDVDTYACAYLHLGAPGSPRPPYGEKWQTKTIVK